MTERTRDATAAIVDGIIKFVAAGGFVTTLLLAPNAIQIFDKPTQKLLNKLDKREQERELRRIAHYMKNRGLIRYTAKDYEHGITLTNKGKQRLKKSTFDSIAIPKQPKWDHKWRLVFFDIPEVERSKRNALIRKLKQLGFKQLQFSVWIHPFPSRGEIEAICQSLDARRYATYVEITKIDSEKVLRKKFESLLS